MGHERSRAAVVAALLAMLAGCGGEGAHGVSDVEPASDLVVAPLTLRGEASRVGGTTEKNVLLRRDPSGIQVVDFAADGRGPGATSVGLSFTSPQIAWGLGSSPADYATELLRSGDGGVTWELVAAIPTDETEHVVDLRVETDTTGEPTAWVAIVSGWEGTTVGVRTRSLDRDAPWTELPGLASSGCSFLARFGSRDGTLELLRGGSSCPFGYGPADDALYPITASGAGPAEPLPGSFVPLDYATAGDHGWIAGRRGNGSTPSDAHVPAIASGRRGEPFVVADVAGLAGGAVTTIDFFDAEHGFACGRDASSQAFCLATGDGGASWTRGTLDLPDPAFSVTDVVRTRDGGGLATLGRLLPGLLETHDEGVSWTRVVLPPLANELEVGALTRVPPAGDAKPADRAASVAGGAPPTSERPMAGAGPGADARAPVVAGLAARAGRGSVARAWAVGDSSRRGPAITGVALRSDDGGLTWDDVLSAPGGSFAGVAFSDADTGWVVGANRIFRTSDGGASFVDQTAAIDFPGRVNGLRLASAADAQHAVVVARTVSDAFFGEEVDTVLHTADGGASWRPAEVASGARFGNEATVEGGICLTRGGSGVAVVYTHVLLTRDAGATWTPGPRFAYAISGDGWSVSGDGFGEPIVACSGNSDLWILVGPFDPRTLDPKTQSLWHSSDGGATWENLSERIGRSSSPLPLVGAFSDTGQGWLVADDERAGTAALLRSLDRGATWRELPSPLVPRASSGRPTVEFPEAMAFASARDGVILTTSFTSARERRHAVLATSDGGDTWRRGSLPDDFHPLGLAYVR